MNKFILESLIFEFMDSNIIGIWNSIVILKYYIWIHELWGLWIKELRIKEQSSSNGYGIVQEWESWKEVL